MMYIISKNFLNNASLLFVLSLLNACSLLSDKFVHSVNQQTVSKPTAIMPNINQVRLVNDEVNNKFTAAHKAMQNKNWQKAERYLNWIIARYPDYSGPVLNLAIVYERRNSWALADINYRKALVLNKRNLTAYNSYAIFLRQQGRFNEAGQYYQKALAIWPNDAGTHRNLGILYELYMGRLAEAQQHYLKYLQLREQAAQVFIPDRPYKQVKGWTIDIVRRLERKERKG